MTCTEFVIGRKKGRGRHRLGMHRRVKNVNYGEESFSEVSYRGKGGEYA